jgi:S1-C subfamily serine protease
VRFFAALLCVLLGTTAAQAQSLRYSSGTGFFVSGQGHVITNAHVIRECTEGITLHGPLEAAATVLGVDETHDLAILQTQATPPRIAPLRWNLSTLRVGQAVNVVGFPGRSGFDGNLQVAKAEMLGFEGPVGEPHFLQFTPSAQKGNSGGPLLDASGNVIGVVTGKTQLYRNDPLGTAAPVLVREADVAVTLPYLRQFLMNYGVHYSQSGSGLITMTPRYIGTVTRDFIVNVRCVVARE